MQTNRSQDAEYLVARARQRELDRAAKEAARLHEQELIKGDKARAKLFRDAQRQEQALAIIKVRQAQQLENPTNLIHTEDTDLTAAHSKIPLDSLDSIHPDKIQRALQTLESRRAASRKYYHAHRDHLKAKRQELNKEQQAIFTLLAAKARLIKDQAKADQAKAAAEAKLAKELALIDAQTAKDLARIEAREAARNIKAASKQAAARANELPAYTAAADRYELFYQKLTEYTPDYLAGTLTPEELAMFQRGLAEFNKIPQYFIREHMVGAPKPWEDLQS